LGRSGFAILANVAVEANNIAAVMKIVLFISAINSCLEIRRIITAIAPC
jgi:hypothetical protein